MGVRNRPVFSFSVFLYVAGRTDTDGRRVEGEKLNQDDGEKAWFFTNHSILSDQAILPRDFRLQSKGTVPNK